MPPPQLFGNRKISIAAQFKHNTPRNHSKEPIKIVNVIKSRKSSKTYDQFLEGNMKVKESMKNVKRGPLIFHPNSLRKSIINNKINEILKTSMFE